MADEITSAAVEKQPQSSSSFSGGMMGMIIHIVVEILAFAAMYFVVHSKISSLNSELTRRIEDLEAASDRHEQVLNKLVSIFRPAAQPTVPQVFTPRTTAPQVSTARAPPVEQPVHRPSAPVEQPVHRPSAPVEQPVPRPSAPVEQPVPRYSGPVPPQQQSMFPLGAGAIIMDGPVGHMDLLSSTIGGFGLIMSTGLKDQEQQPSIHEIVSEDELDKELKEEYQAMSAAS